MLAFVPASALAGEADVLAVRVEQRDTGVVFAVTLRHADEGWDHYADRWDVLGPDGAVLATRVLRHPHVDEQPFTRTLGPVRIPEGIDRVVVRAHDSVHEHGGQSVAVDLR